LFISCVSLSAIFAIVLKCQEGFCQLTYEISRRDNTCVGMSYTEQLIVFLSGPHPDVLDVDLDVWQRNYSLQPGPGHPLHYQRHVKPRGRLAA
jgi:hypothetical protein